jgi:hypothetical protein
MGSSGTWPRRCSRRDLTLYAERASDDGALSFFLAAAGETEVGAWRRCITHCQIWVRSFDSRMARTLTLRPKMNFHGLLGSPLSPPFCRSETVRHTEDRTTFCVGFAAFGVECRIAWRRLFATTLSHDEWRYTSHNLGGA